MASEDVPFVKRSTLWKHIESTDLYRNTRRKPHFSPLLECSEVLREGLAIAHIIRFTTVVEETLKLQFSDSVSVIQKNLQAIADLEKHGFDVEPVRTRLTVLLTMKVKEEKLEAECNEIKSEMTNKALEKEELDQAVPKINQRIEELAEELKEIESKKLIKDKEISTLNSKEEAIRQNVCNLEHEFESIAGGADSDADEAAGNHDGANGDVEEAVGNHDGADGDVGDGQNPLYAIAVERTVAFARKHPEDFGLSDDQIRMLSESVVQGESELPENHPLRMEIMLQVIQRLVNTMEEVMSTVPRPKGKNTAPSPSPSRGNHRDDDDAPPPPSKKARKACGGPIIKG